MNSQNELILNHLRKGKSITAIQALMEYNCFRLAARIKNLRDEGHKINTVKETLSSKKVIARYTLIKEATND